jgi:hypothetical protein
MRRWPEIAPNGLKSARFLYAITLYKAGGRGLRLPLLRGASYAEPVRHCTGPVYDGRGSQGYQGPTGSQGPAHRGSRGRKAHRDCMKTAQKSCQKGVKNARFLMRFCSQKCEHSRRDKRGFQGLETSCSKAGTTVPLAGKAVFTLPGALLRSHSTQLSSWSH